MAECTALAGLQFGDEGKGSLTDFLTRQLRARLVIRHNGGSQAGHHVVLADGRSHCFSQFGAGTFAGARTHLSKYMIVNPITAMNEALGLERLGMVRLFSLMTIHEDALVTTPMHVRANRLREMHRGNARHGSCGMGVGETVQDALTCGPLEVDVLRVRDLRDEKTTRDKLMRLHSRKHAEMASLSAEAGHAMDFTDVEFCMFRYREFMASGVQLVDDFWLEEQLCSPGHILFEGAQGVLLDQDYGFFPHTTWSDCTFGNVDLLVKGLAPVTHLGVLRAFSTRHGAGPFPTERADFAPLVASDHNKEGSWQGAFRAGAFDFVLAEYARSVVGHLDGLCVTCVDKLIEPTTTVCHAYKDSPGTKVLALEKPWELSLETQESTGKYLRQVMPLYKNVETARLPQMIAERLDVRLFAMSNGPTAAAKRLL